MQKPTTALGLKGILALTLGVPAVFLIILELGCRLTALDQRVGGPAASPQLLEMPTWMLAEAGAREKATRLVAGGASIDWLSMFESGEGFRVRLVPGVSREVTNTFSRIRWDRDHPYRVTSNSLGFRGDEPLTIKPANGLRIAIFGDSSSFGWGVDDDQTYGAVLKRELAKALPDRTVEILNFAIPGDSSEYGRLIFERFANTLSLDGVILGFGANDAKRVPVPHAKQVDKFRSSQGLLALQSVLERSALVRTLKAVVLRFKRSPAGEKKLDSKVPAVRKKRYRGNLSQMAKSAKALGASTAAVVALCTPGDYAVVAQQAADESSALFLNGQRMLLAELPAITGGALYPAMVEEMKANYRSDLAVSDLHYISSDGCHPNALGHRLVGERLAAMLLESLPRSLASSEQSERRIELTQ